MEKEGRKEGSILSNQIPTAAFAASKQASKQSSNAASAVVYRTGTRIIHFGLCNG